MEQTAKLSFKSFPNSGIRIENYTFDFIGMKFHQHELVSKEFLFSEDIRNETQRVLNSLKDLFPASTDLKFVSVHARRTDYKEWMKWRLDGSLASKSYFLKAMDIMRARHNSNRTKLLFLVGSDDPDWCKEVFKSLDDVIVINTIHSKYSNVQPTWDLALMSACEHSILRYITMFINTFVQKDLASHSI